MSAPRDDDLERRLGELFEQRAATVTHARHVDLGSDDSGRAATAPGPVRNSRLREHLSLLAAAAVVFIAIAGTVVGIREFHQWQLGNVASDDYGPTSTPSPSMTAPGKPCVASAPASWQQAITGGAFPVDRGINTVVSANGKTGDYLAVQGNEPPGGTSAVYSDVELSLFHGKTGRTIYVPASNTDIPNAHSTGAITADWVAFAVAHPQNMNYYYKVMLYDRGSGDVTTLAEATDQEHTTGKSIVGPPVIAAGKVYWLTATFNKPASTALHSWDLARGSSAGSTPAANATELISYGSGLLVSYGWDHGLNYPVQSRTAMRQGAGRALTRDQLAATARGTHFSYDGAGTLSWLRHGGDSIGYSSLEVGADGVRNDPAIGRHTSTGVAAFPFIQVELEGSGSRYGLLDLRTRTPVALPEGVSLQAVVGETVIFGTGTTKSGAAGLSAVALKDLPPVSC